MSHYQQLVREHRRQEDAEGEGRKRRRRLGPRAVEPVSASENSDSDEFEDVDLDRQATPPPEPSEQPVEEAEDTYDYLGQPQHDQDDTLNITLVKQAPEPVRRKVQFVSKGERLRRTLVHQWYLVAMASHGWVRNRWCCSKILMEFLAKTVPADIRRRLRQLAAKKPGSVHSVQFIDVLRELMVLFGTKFRVTKSGLVRKNWNELHIRQENTARVDFDRFKALCMAFQGSRDLGAQLFCALMRSLGLTARLVFSLQPPDFTLITELPEIQLDPKGATSQGKFLNNKQKFLKQASNKGKSPGYQFAKSAYPVFWVEVFNRFSNKWVSIDPVVLKLVENCPMRRKSSFEPPLNDPTNALTYVLAYDSYGGVKDVTRRYSHQFNSKTVRKRIATKSEVYSEWYTRVIKSLNKRNSLTKRDILESKEFRDRDLTEGMPNSAAGFKDHPIYALESQLRQNEVIYPKDDTTKCGTFRFKVSSKSKKPSELVPVYKRSAVNRLRTARAWYMRGRVLKVGQQPLKIKTKKRNSDTNGNDDDDDDDDDSSDRLYGEFQTKIYLAPPIENGKIPKNAYGNIDLYVPTMIPDGGSLIDTRKRFSIKIAVSAAKILEIDYAKAIVAFDFGGNASKSKGFKRIPTPQEGGVVVSSDHVEAMYLMMEQLEQEEVEKQRKITENNSLKNWKFFLTKLRIARRLDQTHGQFDQQIDDNKINPDNKGEVPANSDVHGYESGGFMPVLATEYDAQQSSRFVPSDEVVSDVKSDSSSSISEAWNPDNSNLSPVTIEPSADFGGGFLLPDFEKSPTPRPVDLEHSDDDFLQDIPPGHFKNVEGHMVYEPDRAGSPPIADAEEARAKVVEAIEVESGSSSSDEAIIEISDNPSDDGLDGYEFVYSDDN